MVLEVQDPGGAWGQVVLYESEDGVLSWHFPDPRPGHPESPTLTYRLPRQVAVPDPEDETAHRGLIGALGKKILQIFVFRLVRDGSSWVGAAFVKEVERRRCPHTLRSFTVEDYATKIAASSPADHLRHCASGRSLLVVHGTFSSTHGGFSRLPVETVKQLHHAYEGRVLAFDHPTVSCTPTENVRWLSKYLRQQQVRLDVDMLCHSRGGLVGRVLGERPDLGQSTEVISVGNLVMVGTPNAGTPLADVARIEHLLNRYTTMLQFLPDNGITDIVDIIVALVKQIAAGVATGLDGLMAMDPASKLLTSELGRVHGAARYYTAAANYDPPAGKSLLRIARSGAIDLVFGHETNDLVVPMSSALADGNLPTVERLGFDTPDLVDHFSYFAQTALSNTLTRWLRG
ncbi:hypothetical protein AB0H76_33955 [Nocardia sp. NPDC050712]|uniref:DUF7379 domain-containing protein n=1 Tax=Nocardia sp. NPDC050712 TaxID=3155518 RepID=UPI003408EB15